MTTVVQLSWADQGYIMAKNFKACVVGTGAISQQHLKFLSGETKYSNSTENITIAGVCDLSPASAEYAKSRYSAINSYTDYTQMLDECQPDVTHILTPPNSHVHLVSQALENGSHVICEKPLATNFDDATSLVNLAASKNLLLIESHNYRFNDEIVKLNSIISNGDIGDVREVGIRIALDIANPQGAFGDQNVKHPVHSLPAGVIGDFITHMTYLLLQASQNAHFDQVKSLWLNQSGNPVFKYDNLDAILFGENETGPVHGRLRLDSDLYPDSFSVTARGTKGYTHTDMFDPTVTVVKQRSVGNQLSPLVNNFANSKSVGMGGIKNLGKKVLNKSPYHGLYKMLDLIYVALVNGDNPPITSKEILDTSRLIDLVVDSKEQ